MCIRDKYIAAWIYDVKWGNPSSGTTDNVKRRAAEIVQDIIYIPERLTTNGQRQFVLGMYINQENNESSEEGAE